METRVKRRNGGCSSCVTSWLDSLCESKPLSGRSVQSEVGLGAEASVRDCKWSICLCTIYPVSNSIIYDKGPLALIVPGIQTSFNENLCAYTASPTSKCLSFLHSSWCSF